jgi:mRNA-degrading endonuclease RelE of RelBE toxin-antitoxin system
MTPIEKFLKKLNGNDMYRARVGRVRIIFIYNGTSSKIVYVGFRDEQTYNF